MAAIRVWNRTIDPDARLAGTLTCVARIVDDPAHLVAVTAAHVIAPLFAPGTQPPRAGDEIEFDLGSQDPVVGRLWYWNDLQRLSEGFINTVDAALVDVDASHAAALVAALGQPAARGSPAAGADIEFTGIASGTRRGKFEGIREPAHAYSPVLGGTFASVAFNDTLLGEIKSAHGDSGSLIVSHEGGVGLLISDEGERSRFLSLDTVFKEYSLDWLDAAAPAQPPGSTVLPAAVVPDRQQALDTLARTLWGEARGEPLAGIRTIAAVVLNRAMHATVHWWGTSIVGVCRAPKQFSCWNATDPNLPKLLAVTDADPKFRICLDVAGDALDGRLQQERALGATHYHTKSVSPSWAKGKVPCADIGNHLFYNDIA